MKFQKNFGEKKNIKLYNKNIDLTSEESHSFLLSPTENRFLNDS